MANVRLDGVDIIKSQTHVSNGTAGLKVDDVVTKLEGVDLTQGEEIAVTKIDSSTIQDGQVLTYASGKWRNNDITAAGSAVNNDLGISRTGITSDPAIEYNFGNNPNTTFLLNGSNATISNLQAGDTVVWDADNSTWKNQQGGVGGGSNASGFYVQTSGSDTDYYFNSMPSTTGIMAGLDVQTSGSDTDYIFNSGVTLGSMDTSNLSDGATAFWSASENKWKMSSMVIEEI